MVFGTGTNGVVEDEDDEEDAEEVVVTGQVKPVVPDTSCAVEESRAGQ